MEENLTIDEHYLFSRSYNGILIYTSKEKLCLPKCASIAIDAWPRVLAVSVTGLEPDFSYPLENVTIPQGRDATFTCVVNNLGGYRVSPSSSASGDHSGSGKARVTILPLNLCPPVMDYSTTYLLLTLPLLFLLLSLHHLYARVPAPHSTAFNCTLSPELYEKKKKIYIYILSPPLRAAELVSSIIFYMWHSFSSISWHREALASNDDAVTKTSYTVKKFVFNSIHFTCPQKFYTYINFTRFICMNVCVCVEQKYKHYVF